MDYPFVNCPDQDMTYKKEPFQKETWHICTPHKTIKNQEKVTRSSITKIICKCGNVISSYN